MRALHLAIDRAPSAMMVVDAAGKIVVANEAAKRLPKVVPGRPLGDATCSAQSYIQLTLKLAIGTTTPVPLRLRFDTTTVPFDAWRIDPLPGLDGPLAMVRADPSRAIHMRPAPVSGSPSEVAQRLSATESELDHLRREARRLRSLAETDRLTGALNASAFEQRCRRRLQIDGNCGALVFADLNDFKPVNDRFGHAAGDFVLRETTRRLRSRMRSYDLLGRLGGDEFGLWLEGVGEHDIHGLLTRLHEVTARPLTWRNGDDEVTIRVTLAFGSAAVPVDGDCFSSLRALADARMYLEKKRAHVRRA